MIGHDPYCGRKIQASHPAPDGYPVARKTIPDIGGKAHGLLSKKQIIPILNYCL
jgi:hypothetical protein